MMFGAGDMTLSMIIAQAQSLSMVLEDVTKGECADCGCSSCVSLRGMMAALPDGTVS